MTSIILRKKGQSLIPIDIVGEERLAKIKEDVLVMADPKMSRNLKHHQKFWMLCHFCADHSDYMAEQVCNIFKLRAGLTTQSQLSDGTIVQHPGSIAWANMDQIAFEEFYERVMGVVARDIIPGVDREDLRQALVAFTEPNY